MAQDITSKQVNFVGRYVQGITGLIAAVEGLNTLADEWIANAYAAGAPPTASNITDAVLQGGGYAYLTAAQLNSAVAAAAAIGQVADANRGYLEALRP